MFAIEKTVLISDLNMHFKKIFAGYIQGQPNQKRAYLQSGKSFQDALKSQTLDGLEGVLQEANKDGSTGLYTDSSGQKYISAVTTKLLKDAFITSSSSLSKETQNQLSNALKSALQSVPNQAHRTDLKAVL